MAALAVTSRRVNGDYNTNRTLFFGINRGW